MPSTGTAYMPPGGEKLLEASLSVLAKQAMKRDVADEAGNKLVTGPGIFVRK